MKRPMFLVLTALLILQCGCSNDSKTKYGEKTIIRTETVKIQDKDARTLINDDGRTIQERFDVPVGFDRVAADTDSFGEYLRNLPLKPAGSQVTYYNGEIKPAPVYEAVVDMDVGDRDLQQCADSVIRLRAEYLYQKNLFDRIAFHFTNGFKADFSKWSQGYRIKVSGNNASWIKQTGAANDYSSFRKYLDIVFAYSGTLSLSKEMDGVPVSDIRLGDVFIKGGSPGHCVIIVDMAENKASGEKLFMLAQGYMPAQDIHILKNPANSEGNPWYSMNFGDTLVTPEWDFTRDQLMRFAG